MNQLPKTAKGRAAWPTCAGAPIVWVMSALTAGIRNVWVLVTRSEEMPDKWVAHCLDLDIVTQGDSVDHAFAMAREAVNMVIQDDLAEGLNPFDRQPAPGEDWAELYSLMHDGVPRDAIPVEERGAVTAVAAQLRLDVVSRSEETGTFAPELWQLVALNQMRRSGAPTSR